MSARARRWLRRIGIALGSLAVVWLGTLFIAGYAARGCVKRRAERRVRASMRAEVVTLGGVELGLLRGRLGFDLLHIERSARGYLRIDVAHAETDVWPLGLVLLQDSLGELSARGVDIEVSALGALDLRGGERAPLTFERLELHDVRLAFEATSMLPGLLRIQVAIARVVVGHTTLRTPLSWVFGLQELDADLALFTGGTARLSYRRGKPLLLSGPAFGARPVEIAVDIPALDPEREPEQLAALGRRVASELTKQGGKAWLWEKAKQRLIDEADKLKR